MPSPTKSGRPHCHQHRSLAERASLHPLTNDRDPPVIQSLAFTEIQRLAGYQLGTFDVSCEECGIRCNANTDFT